MKLRGNLVYLILQASYYLTDEGTYYVKSYRGQKKSDQHIEALEPCGQVKALCLKDANQQNIQVCSAKCSSPGEGVRVWLTIEDAGLLVLIIGRELEPGRFKSFEEQLP